MIVPAIFKKRLLQSRTSPFSALPLTAWTRMVVEENCKPLLDQGGKRMSPLRKRTKYLIDERLEDVLALIQVLALDKDSHRSEEGLKSELPARPNSSESWSELAKEHQDFFDSYQVRSTPCHW